MGQTHKTNNTSDIRLKWPVQDNIGAFHPKPFPHIPYHQYITFVKYKG